MDKHILIIGRGFIGSELNNKLKNAHLMSHDENYKSYLKQYQPDIVINAAAIVGQKKCTDAGRETTFKANVDFAIAIAEEASKLGKKSLLFSTGAVYKNPHSTPKREVDEVNPNNLYTESKIVMEERCEGLDTTIFRIPVVLGSGYYPGDYRNRIKNYAWAQGCYISILHISTLVEAVNWILHHYAKGIFNIADYEFHYQPDFVKRNSRSVPVWDNIPPDFTQTHILDSNKARTGGILK